MFLENSSYPAARLRRNRSNQWLREMIAETTLQPRDLVLPVFVTESEERQAVKSMPGVFRYPVSELERIVSKAISLGIPAIAIFPATPAHLKTEDAIEAWNAENLICRSIRRIKKQFPEQIGIIADVALDPYTSHGHDGILKNGDVDNDLTIEALCKQAINQAQAGCDIVAPSDMMDGRVGAIRKALDDEGFINVKILCYSAKYASHFYGPFRDAVGSSSNLGKADKRSYQMDPANSREALREVAMDISEGADIVMVKPALPYLDIIRQTRENFAIPVFAYQVSGEYAMLRFASENGAFEFLPAMLESLLAIKRAGADAILTYAAMEVAEIL
jgi:porphobilinogen synthase